MKLRELYENSEAEAEADTDTLHYIKVALDQLHWDHLTPEEVFAFYKKDMSQHLQQMYDRGTREWIDHIKYDFKPPEPKTLVDKIKAAAKRFNSEIMHDEVEYGLRKQYGNDVDNLSVDDIAKFIKDGEWFYGPI